MCSQVWWRVVAICFGRELLQEEERGTDGYLWRPPETILASQTIAIAEESLAFSNRKVQIASFTAEIAGTSPKNQKIAKKIVENILGAV